MAREQGSNTRLAMAWESTYGTAPASGFFQMPFAPGLTLSASQALLDPELLGYGRDPRAPTPDAINVAGNVVVPMDLRNFGHWLKGAFGAPVTTGAGPYTHVFTSGAQTLPSLSIEKGFPNVPEFTMLTGCVVGSVGWTRQRTGLLTATVEVMGQDEAPATTTQAGTPTELALARFGHVHGTIQRNGSPLGTIVQAEFSYSNNLDPVEDAGGGSLVGGFDPAMAAATGNLVTRYADRTLFTQAIAAVSCSLEFGFSLGTNQTLTVSLPQVYLERPSKPVEGPGGLQATIAYRAAYDASDAAMVTVTLVNDVETY